MDVGAGLASSVGSVAEHSDSWFLRSGPRPLGASSSCVLRREHGVHMWGAKGGGHECQQSSCPGIHRTQAFTTGRDWSLLSQQGLGCGLGLLSPPSSCRWATHILGIQGLCCRGAQHGAWHIAPGHRVTRAVVGRVPGREEDSHADVARRRFGTYI